MMGYPSRLVAALVCLAALGTVCKARAEQVRAVLLVKHTLDGKVKDDAPLEAAAMGALSRAGVRLIEIDTALSSQKAVFSDLIQAGTLPPALSTLNADALLSVQLACDQSGEKLLGSAFRSYLCTLNTKAVRVDTGEVVFSGSEPLPSHGLNASMAVQALLGGKAKALIASHSKEWLSAWHGASGFSVDLIISGIADLSQRDQLRAELAKMSGVTEVRSVYFRDGLAKLTLVGKGESELAKLASTIEHSDLALRMTREAGRTLYAQLDLSKAYARDAVFYLELPAEGDPARGIIEEVGPDVMQTSLRNVPYLRPLHARPLSGAKRSAAALAQIVPVRADPRSLLIVTARVRREGDTWTSHLAVSDARGAAMAGGAATGTDLAEAVQASARVLDAAMLSELSNPDGRQRMGLGYPAGELPPRAPMLVERFQVRGERDGLLHLRNVSTSALSDCSVELQVAGFPAGQVRLADLPAGKGRTVPLSFATLPSGLDEDAYTNVSATVRYRAGEAYGDTRADAIWMRGTRRAPAPSTERKRPTSESRNAYATVTQQGVSASREGDWPRAKQLFLEAHRLEPSARTLRALGMVSFDLGEYEQAARYLRDALTSDAKALTPTMQGQARELLERTARALGDADLRTR